MKSLINKTTNLKAQRKLQHAAKMTIAKFEELDSTAEAKSMQTGDFNVQPIYPEKCLNVA